MSADTPSGFSSVGDAQACQKSFYIERGLVADGKLDVKSAVTSDWSNIFCSVNVRALYCDEYVALANAVG